MSFAWFKTLAPPSFGSVLKLFTASLVASSIGLTGCGEDPVKKGVAKGCTLNSDCDSGLVCSFGLCHEACEVSSDCPANQRCIQTDTRNVCQLDAETQCAFNTDCEPPLVCARDLECRNECHGDADCLDGQVCAEGNVCAEPREVDDDGNLINAEGGTGGTGGSGGKGGGGGKGGTTGGGTGGTVGGTSGEGGASGGGGESGEAGGGGSGGAPETCTPGGACTPEGDPCKMGEIECDGNTPVCAVTGDAMDGNECGDDRVCSGGECVSCVEGETCSPDSGNACVAGIVSCTVGPECEADGNVEDGTDCGNDLVCSDGECVTCSPGDACEPPNAPCKNGTLSCTNGPVCTPTTNKTAGDECGSDRVCNSAGSCVTCVEAEPCDIPGNQCHLGAMECDNGPNCVDTGAAGPDGVSCSGPSTYNFCAGGQCLACQNGNPCVPANPCHKGTLNCGTAPPTCNDSSQNADDGLVCGDDKSCISGVCVTNDRTLTITSGAIAAVPIDAPFAPVTVRLRDASDAPVPGANVVVTASAGAYGASSAATNSQGNAQISGRVGREIGTHTFTVSAPGATPIQFTVEAVAPEANHIFTPVNVNHLSGTSTVPGPGTLSKLYNAAQAVTAATDGTLYIASYCAVFKLSPAGVLTRVAGDAAESCGFSGDSGPGSTARVYSPGGLALDEVNGFLYIADTYNYRVRQIDLSTGNILTFAGGAGANSAPWGDGGPADQAYLTPSNVSVAPNGDVYISDSNSSRVRKVDFVTGIISTYLRYTTCDPNALSFQACYGLGNACDMAWDSNGTAFVAGYFCGGGLSGFYGVARVESDGSLVRIAGSPGSATPAEGGVATSASFSDTPAIEFDQAGNLFMTTRSDHRVRRVDAITRKITTIAGTGAYGYSGEYVAGSTAQVYYPSTVALDGDGHVYFADSSNYAVRSVWSVGKTDPPSGTLAKTAGTGQSVSVDAPFAALSVNVKDGAGANIQGIDVTWKRMETGSGLGATGASVLETKTIASGNSSMTGRVGLATGAYTFQASYTDIHGTHVSGSPQTFSVTAVAPAAGTIFPVVNYVHTSATLSGVPGPATYAKIQSYALGVAAKSDGTLYVTDACAVYEVTPRGEISVFAGTPGSCGTTAGDSGPAVGARLYYPEGLALDEARGVLYIADSSNARIRSVSLSTGVINTFAGGGATTTPPYGDGGPAAEANIGVVANVSVGPDGKVYIPDSYHSRFRVVDPDTEIITTFMTGNTTCVAGTASLYSVDPNGSVVRWLDDGSAYVSGYICPGNGTTSAALGILHRAANGTLTRVAGVYNGAQTEGADAVATTFPAIGDMIVDQNGDLVVATYSDNRVRRINMSTGKINTIAGDGTAGYFQPADMSISPGDYVPATSVRLYYPFKLAVTPTGHLVIADYHNLTYRMIW